MITLALTGGIATGKSTAIRHFREFVPDIVVFDCDESVKGLFATEEVIAEITRHFGKAILDPGTGKIDRGKLRAEVFGDDGKRKLLEGILHPRVRQECLALREKAAKQGVRCFLADVPLLFENGFDFGQSQAITVSTTRATQVTRLKARNGWDDNLIESVLAAQLPIEEKSAARTSSFGTTANPPSSNRRSSASARFSHHSPCQNIPNNNPRLRKNPHPPPLRKPPPSNNRLPTPCPRPSISMSSA